MGKSPVKKKKASRHLNPLKNNTSEQNVVLKKKSFSKDCVDNVLSSVKALMPGTVGPVPG